MLHFSLFDPIRLYHIIRIKSEREIVANLYLQSSTTAKKKRTILFINLNAPADTFNVLFLFCLVCFFCSSYGCSVVFPQDLFANDEMLIRFKSSCVVLYEFYLKIMRRFCVYVCACVYFFSLLLLLTLLYVINDWWNTKYKYNMLATKFKCLFCSGYVFFFPSAFNLLFISFYF